jgi:hypothetical protein
MPLKLQNLLPHWQCEKLLRAADSSDRSEYTKKRGGGKQQK